MERVITVFDCSRRQVTDYRARQGVGLGSVHVSGAEPGGVRRGQRGGEGARLRPPGPSPGAQALPSDCPGVYERGATL